MQTMEGHQKFQRTYQWNETFLSEELSRRTNLPSGSTSLNCTTSVLDEVTCKNARSVFYESCGEWLLSQASTWKEEETSLLILRTSLDNSGVKSKSLRLRLRELPKLRDLVSFNLEDGLKVETAIRLIKIPMPHKPPNQPVLFYLQQLPIGSDLIVKLDLHVH